MKSGIYKITNDVTGKFYVGSAKDIDWRWTIHRRDLRAGRHCNPKFQHSWNFHGEDKFTLSILEEVEQIRRNYLNVSSITSIHLNPMSERLDITLGIKPRVEIILPITPIVMLS